MADDDPIPDALEQLAKADNQSALRAAHRALSDSLRLKRRRAAKKLGPLARAFTEAMEILDTQKAAGVPFDERIKGLEQVLRNFWPQTRAWHYLCDACRDTGLVIHVCKVGARCDGRSTRIDSPGATPGKYRRLCATDPASSYEHDCGTPCSCPRGVRFRETPKARPDDFASAGKSKPMTRLGR